MIFGIHIKGVPLVTTLLLSLTVLPTSVFSQDNVQSIERRVQESQIREAVIRFQMEERLRNMGKYEAQTKEPWEKETARELDYKVYFISINGRDPSDEFVQRFSDIPRLVKKASKAQGGLAGVLDRETHQTGIIFNASMVRWLKSDSVEVDGGFYCGGRCARASTFAVHLEAGKWIAKLLRVNAES